jgi:hypothetical protein
VVVVAGVELCSVPCCVCRGGERSRKQEQRKEKGERGIGKRKKEEGASAKFAATVASVRRDARGGAASAGFAATVASAGLSTRHGVRVEEERKDGDYLLGVRRRDAGELFWAIKSSGCRGF